MLHSILLVIHIASAFCIVALVLVQRGKGAEIGRLDLARPLTVDNFEGLAAVPAPDGGVRFYLISDDNFSPSQRTLQLAFDWK